MKKERNGIRRTDRKIIMKHTCGTNQARTEEFHKKKVTEDCACSCLGIKCARNDAQF